MITRGIRSYRGYPRFFVSRRYENTTLLIQNIAGTYQELTSVMFVEPFLPYVFSRSVDRPIIFMKPLGSRARVHRRHK